MADVDGTSYKAESADTGMLFVQEVEEEKDVRDRISNLPNQPGSTKENSLLKSPKEKTRPRKVIRR